MGRFKVFSRCRPPTAEEAASDTEACIFNSDGQQLDVRVESHRAGGGATMTRRFAMNRAFDAAATQADLYEAVGKPLVQSVLEGFNAGIMAYGQSGSGKTHTMFGPPPSSSRATRSSSASEVDALLNPLTAGVVPRMMEHFFQRLSRAEARDFELRFQVTCKFVEVYQDKLIDLLVPRERFAGSRLKSSASITKDKEGGDHLKATEVPASSPEDVLSALRVGLARREVGGTKLNPTSSRSHAVFVLHLRAVDGGKGEVRTSELILADLAGSESSASASTVKQAAEGRMINASLATLGNVIRHLASGRAAKSFLFRASKLTRLLSSMLGGNATCHVVVNHSPSMAKAAETARSLAFGASASSIAPTALKVNSERSAPLLRKMIEAASGVNAENERQIAGLSLTVSRFERIAKAALARYPPNSPGALDLLRRFPILRTLRPTRSWFEQVHHNLLHRILYHLDPPTLAAAAAVCAPWREALTLPHVWHDVLFYYRAAAATSSDAAAAPALASRRAATRARAKKIHGWRRFPAERKEYILHVLAEAADRLAKREGRRKGMAVALNVPGVLTLIRT